MRRVARLTFAMSNTEIDGGLSNSVGENVLGED